PHPFFRSSFNSNEMHPYEMDYAEAAEVLRVPIGTLKSRLARARLQMKEKLRCNAWDYAASRIENRSEACFGIG
ncbi:MAG: sigma factor-like helix-turn-helix DNA-binding protein, partial [Chloroflexota bacterium]